MFSVLTSDVRMILPMRNGSAYWLQLMFNQTKLTNDEVTYIGAYLGQRGCSCRLESTQTGETHDQRCILKMESTKVGFRELTRFVTPFFACCVPDYSDINEDAANVFGVLPDSSHGDRDRMGNDFWGSDAKSAVDGSSIVKVPGEANTVDTMRAVPKLFDLAET